MRVSLLILVVLLGAVGAASADIQVIISFGAPAPCYGPPIRYAPSQCNNVQVWRQTCQPQFANPGFNVGYGNSRIEQINRAQQQLRAQENLRRAEDNAQCCFDKWQRLKCRTSFSSRQDYDNWCMSVLSAERTFINADIARQNALAKCQTGGYW